MDYITAWQCIGCGRIEAPQPCIGVCQDRKVQFVGVQDYEDALALARNAQRRAEGLVSLMRKLALIRPREGQWEPCLRALQEEARGALAALAVSDVPAPAPLPAKP